MKNGQKCYLIFGVSSGKTSLSKKGLDVETIIVKCGLCKKSIVIHFDPKKDEWRGFHAECMLKPKVLAKG